MSALDWTKGFAVAVGWGGLVAVVDGPGPVFSFGFVVEPGWGMSWYRHEGQVPFCFNHGRMQGEWKGCLQGSSITTCSSGSSVFKENWSLQTAQSFSRRAARNELSTSVGLKGRRVTYSLLQALHASTC